MCGLAGYARHPDGKDHELATLIGLDLLLAMQARGTHATGIGVFGKDEAFICKSAVDAKTALDSAPWKDALGKIGQDTTIVLGHTRHSTHPSNTKLDEAAHPFHIGKVVGAHNGMIGNWREVYNALGNKNGAPWIVDSQAAIGALDAIDDPVKALDQLDGYWALSWVKGDTLYFSRTPGYGAPLAVCYVPEMLTLFWASNLNVVEAIVKKAGIKDYNAFDLGDRSIYKVDPTAFDEKGPHLTHKHAPFKGLRSTPTARQIAATSGGKGGRRGNGPLPRSEVRTLVGGMTPDEVVELCKKHDTFIQYIFKRLKEQQEEIDMLLKIAGMKDEDEKGDGQLELIGS